MECIVDTNKKLAQVWMSHADQASEEKREKLRGFIADCKRKEIFVCVYESGDGDLLENTMDILTYNYSNGINRSTVHKKTNDAR